MYLTETQKINLICDLIIKKLKEKSYTKKHFKRVIKAEFDKYEDYMVKKYTPIAASIHDRQFPNLHRSSYIKSRFLDIDFESAIDLLLYSYRIKLKNEKYLLCKINTGKPIKQKQ